MEPSNVDAPPVDDDLMDYDETVTPPDGDSPGGGNVIYEPHDDHHDEADRDSDEEFNAVEPAVDLDAMEVDAGENAEIVQGHRFQDSDDDGNDKVGPAEENDEAQKANGYSNLSDAPQKLYHATAPKELVPFATFMREGKSHRIRRFRYRSREISEPKRSFQSLNLFRATLIPVQCMLTFIFPYFSGDSDPGETL
jgi:hypothetical protein